MPSEIALKILRDYLRLNDLRYTPQRETVLSYFLNTEGHISAEDLFNKIHRKHPDIGVATVRRSLNLFEKCKLASRFKFGDNQSVYEPRNEHHDHLICINCGKILEFKNDEIEKLQIKIAKENGFLIKNHRFEIYGYCSNCHVDK